MASDALIGFLIGIGFAGWVYSKVMHSTGSNVKSSLIVAGCAGLGAMALTTILLGAFLKQS